MFNLVLLLVAGVLPKLPDCTARELYVRGMELSHYIALREPLFVFSRRYRVSSHGKSSSATHFPEGSMIRRGKVMYYLGHEKLATETLVRADTVYRVVGIARPESLRLFGRVEDSLGFHRVKRGMRGYWRSGIRHTLFNLQGEFSATMEQYTSPGKPIRGGGLSPGYPTITGDQAVAMVMARWESLRNGWVQQHWTRDSAVWDSIWVDSMQSRR